jgi:hypothetical protein
LSKICYLFLNILYLSLFFLSLICRATPNETISTSHLFIQSATQNSSSKYKSNAWEQQFKVYSFKVIDIKDVAPIISMTSQIVNHNMIMRNKIRTLSQSDVPDFGDTSWPLNTKSKQSVALATQKYIIFIGQI